MEKLKYSPLTYRLAVGCFFFTQGLVFSSWASRIADIKTALKLSDANLGGILFALPLGQMLAMGISGHLVTRLSSSKTVTIGGILYPLGLIGLAMANSAATLFAALMLYGMCANLQNISINTQAVDVERIYGRPIMATFHGVWSLAGFVGGVISTFLVARHVTVMQHFIAMNVFTLIALAVLRNRVVPFDFKPEPNPADKGKTRGFLRPTPYIIFLGIISFGCMSCEGTMFDWSVIYFESIVKAPLDLTRLGFVCFMCTMAGGRFVADRFVMRFGAIRVLRASGIVIMSGMLLAVLFPNIWTSAIGFLFVGAGVSSVVPTCYSLAGRSRRMSSSIALASVSTIGFFGFLMGPPLIGFIAEMSSLRISFAVMACIGLLVTVMAPKLRTHVEN